MRAILCKDYGPPESLVLEDIESPTAGENDVVIKVHNAAVNYPDVLVIQNLYQIKPLCPFLLVEKFPAKSSPQVIKSIR